MSKSFSFSTITGLTISTIGFSSTIATGSETGFTVSFCAERQPFKANTDNANIANNRNDFYWIKLSFSFFFLLYHFGKSFLVILQLLFSCWIHYVTILHNNLYPKVSLICTICSKMLFSAK